MKSKNDPRHQKRIKNIQALFAWSLIPASLDKSIIEIIPKIPEIDQLISVAAPKWPIDQINKIELAILRYAVWELQNQQEIPEKVVIDEAIEIAKEYGDTNSASFINAVLGFILKKQHEQDWRTSGKNHFLF